MLSDNGEFVVPSPPEIPKGIQPIYQEFTQALGLKSLDEKSSLAQVMVKGLSENLAGVELLKPNSIAFALKSLQLEGKIPSDPDELKKYLSRARIGLVDIGNLKMINEDRSVEGSSYAAGNAAIHLHIESITKATQELGITMSLHRPQGDEILPILMSDKEIDPKLLEQTIVKYTNQLIAAIKLDPSHDLHLIAERHSNLITKSMSFAKLKDVKLPSHDLRMGDISEILLSQAEAAEASKQDEHEPNIFKRSYKTYIKHFLPEKIFDINTEENIHAVDAIINAVNETTSISPKENDASSLLKRWELVYKYCPPSLQKSIETLKNSTQDDLDKQAIVLTVLDEAIFNTQLQRDPPFLNRWVYLELTQNSKYNSEKFRYTETGMVSTFFLKLINTLDGRLGGNKVLESATSTLSSSAKLDETSDQTDIIFCKDGGSTYWSATENAAEILTKRLNSVLESKISQLSIDLQKYKAFDKATIAQVIRFWTTIPVFSSLTIPQNGDVVRSQDFFGKHLDSLRNLHYQNESELANYINSISHAASSLAHIVYSAFIKEREVRRVSDLTKIWKIR